MTEHREDSDSTSWVETRADRAFERQEMDPLGQEVGTADPFLIAPNPDYADVHGDSPMFLDGGDPFHLSDGCGDIDGMPASCAEISERTKNGTAVYDSEEWGRRSNGRGGLENYVVHASPIFDQTLSNLNVLDSVWVPDYNDATKDHTDPETGAWVGVTSGRFVSTGVSRFTTSLTPQKTNSFTRAVDEAFDRVANIFKNKPNSSCAKWFGSDALTVLEGMRQTPPTVKPKVDTPGATATGIQQNYGQSRTGVYGRYRLPTDFTVFQNGPFFAGGKGSIGGYAPGTYGAQNLAILHELAHNIMKPGKGYLIPNDGQDADQSRDNTAEVLKHCKQEVFDAK